MATPTNEELARELAALRAQLAPTPVPARRRTRRFNPRRWARVGVIGGLLALVPLSTFAATITITDLGDAAPVHRPNIVAIAEAGITTGFDDPNSSDPNVRIYNPKDNVTREEMASFLARLGGFGGNPPVANAATAVEALNARNAQTAQSVAPGAITPASISAAGATPGQVLTATGDGGVAFRNPAGGGGVANAIVRQETINLAAGATESATVACLAGERATGGGYSTVTGITVGADRPTFAPADNSPTGWTVSATSALATPGALVVYAVCVPTP